MSSFEYLPYDDGTQIARQIEGYPRSFTRTPSQPLIRRPTTLSELTGPTGLERKLKIGFEDGRRAMGQLIAVEGRVVDEDGAPMAGAVMEIWQANSAGKYIHELDRHEAPTARGQHIFLTGRVVEDAKAPVGNAILEIWQADANGIFRHPLDPRCLEADPGFFGWGRARTDAQGQYRFRTVVPGSYGERRPHINMMVLSIGLTRRLVTTVFFTDSRGDIEDPVVSSVPEAARRRLLAVRDESLDATGIAGYRFDIVLRGENETPFFLD